MSEPIQFRRPPTPPPPAARVCPMLTLAVIQKPQSALVGGEPGSLATVNCLGMKCAIFHPAGGCALIVAADALFTQANIMLSEAEAEVVAPPPDGTKQ